MTLQFHNTLIRRKAPFQPLDPANIRMYVCGPTVYASPHLGNARSVVVYDVLFRLLRAVYGADRVIYARNITDIDDKINAAAIERGITIRQLTDGVIAEFNADIAALGCLPPTIEPKATEHIPQIIAMIERLMAGGHAYAAEGHVLFEIVSGPPRGRESQVASEATDRLEMSDTPDLRFPSPWRYGMLSGRSPDEMLAGARVEVAPYKKNPGDFVLWKPAAAADDASARFESPWGTGRPGWHIECSAMSTAHLGETFDIHGGGADLMFPHHENEIAQSCCANPGSEFAKLWMHNGFLTVNGEKMSKSLGNFITVRDLLDRGVEGEVIRFALLSAHYHKPLDWTEKLLEDAKKQLDGFYRAIAETAQSPDMRPGFLAQLSDDLNVPETIGALHNMEKCHLKASGALLGLLQHDPDAWFKGASDGDGIRSRIEARWAAKKAKDWAEADRIRDEMKAEGIELMDRPDGTSDWRRL